MKIFPITAARRVVAVAVAAVAGLAISTAAYAATSSSGTPAIVIPKCTASDLGVWVAVDQGNGAAGTIYYPLEFTNLSHHTCYLFGYPGVSALDVNGRQLGSPADSGRRALEEAEDHLVRAHQDRAEVPHRLTTGVHLGSRCNRALVEPAGSEGRKELAGGCARPHRAGFRRDKDRVAGHRAHRRSAGQGR